MTKETLIISRASSKLVDVMAELRRRKQQKLDKLRKMEPEDFSRRVILS